MRRIFINIKEFQSELPPFFGCAATLSGIYRYIGTVMPHSAFSVVIIPVMDDAAGGKIFTAAPQSLPDIPKSNFSIGYGSY